MRPGRRGRSRGGLLPAQGAAHLSAMLFDRDSGELARSSGNPVQPGELRLARFGVPLFFKLLEHSGMGKSSCRAGDLVVPGRRGTLLAVVSSSLRVVCTTVDQPKATGCRAHRFVPGGAGLAFLSLVCDALLGGEHFTRERTRVSTPFWGDACSRSWRIRGLAIGWSG